MSENSNFPIRSWSEDDKPREKLMLKGKNALSDAELLAILIGSGSKNETAVSLSKRILSSAGNNLNSLYKMSLKQFMGFKGIGEAKAIAIVAALELSARRKASELMEPEKIRSSQTIFDVMLPIIGALPHEEFWVIYLNNANRVLTKLQLSKGGITGTLVDVRLVFKSALELGATAVILCHNHPSGTLIASDSDKAITRKLVAAGENLDIRVLDHVIITDENYYSFADEGIL
ncbi:MAG: hypothetical protein CFE23_03860 [Flavobacterium sp. BFFFF1]|uniref:RadC family protein n=1 Tax=unclassified Flavobacterium TaxID=196869 RepID=UPI000BC9CD5A|nr:MULTISPECIES: DNA repair protein RadC [unclassified Flavobacterium]OYU81616.1 MAG: hypothetical protein CFE23_03860 [Flavobacterium sp. BFFFF1]